VIHPFSSWIREANEQLNALRVHRGRLTELGWTDFQEDLPRPAGESLYKFVTDAVLMVCFDEEGRWCRDESILYAIVRATEVVSSIQVSDVEFRALVDLALQGDSKGSEVAFWLQVHFGPNAST
jgi:hypothetical protein